MERHGEQPTDEFLVAGREALDLPGAHTYRVSESEAAPPAPPSAGEAERTIELRAEQLVAHKDLRERGEIRVRTTVDEVPGRLEVEAYREEVEVEHAPVGQVVTERVGPWEEDGVLVVPVYEEQLVVVKRLVLREHLRVRRVSSAERQLFEDTLRRDRLLIEDPSNTGLVHEQYPAEAGSDKEPEEGAKHEGGNVLERAVRKVFE